MKASRLEIGLWLAKQLSGWRNN